MEKSYSASTGKTNLTQHITNFHRVAIPSSSTSKNQRKLDEVFFPDGKKRKVSDGQNNPESQYIFTRRLVIMICRDLLPYDLVAKEGFKDFWESVKNSDHIMPSRTTVSVSALDDVYACFKKKLIEQLAAAPPHGTITTDLWTDKFKRTAYVAYTYHYMSGTWNINTAVLATAQFEHPHTAKRLVENFTQIVNEFGITSKKLTIVSDGESAIKKASKDLKLRRLHCISHCIHLLLSVDLLKHESMTNIRALLNKLRKINKTLIYRHNELKKYDIEERQRKLFMAVDEFAKMEEILENEERFYNDVEIGDDYVVDMDEHLSLHDIHVSKKFSGLAKMNLTRWNSIPRMGRSHLKYFHK